MDKPTSEERRRSPRVPLVAKGTVVNRSSSGAAPLELVTTNVSEGGLQFHSRNGEILSEHDFLVISFPGLTTPEPVQFKAQVAWINRAPRSERGAWSIGCSFFGMKANAVMHLLIWAHREGAKGQTPQTA